MVASAVKRRYGLRLLAIDGEREEERGNGRDGKESTVLALNRKKGMGRACGWRCARWRDGTGAGWVAAALASGS